MLPYVHLGALHIGSRSIYPFAILVLAGILAGTAMLVWRAGKLGLDRQIAFRLAAVRFASGWTACTSRARRVSFSPPIRRGDCSRPWQEP
jgi:hypothetical protein